MAHYGVWCKEVIHVKENPTKRQRTLYTKLTGRTMPLGATRLDADTLITEAVNG